MLMLTKIYAQEKNNHTIPLSGSYYFKCTYLFSYNNGVNALWYLALQSVYVLLKSPSMLQQSP